MKQLIVLCIAIFLFTSCKKSSLQAESLVNDAKKEITFVDSLPVNTAGFKGLNWARPTTNYSNYGITLSGLDSTDNYSSSASKSDSILSQFKRLIPGVNTIRLPINEPTALGSRWSPHTAAIDKALEKNMKVIIAYWCQDSPRTHRVNDPTAFYEMWDVVVDKYKSNELVYFEVFNEPVGYTNTTELIDLYETFLTRYQYDIPKSRVILDGTGWASVIAPIGAAFPDCLLSLHHYPGWGSGGTSVSSWESNWRSELGVYANRTIVTEFGAVQTLKAGMTVPNDYTGEIVNGDIAFIVGGTNVLRHENVGSIYWAGLRLDSPNDYNSMLERTAPGSLELQIRNHSAISRLRYGWGETLFIQNGTYKIKNKQSNKYLDVILESVTDSAQIVQYSLASRNSQLWQINELENGFAQLKNLNSLKSVVVKDGSKDNNKELVQHTYSGINSEQWIFVPIPGTAYFKILNRNSGRALSVLASSTADDAIVVQRTFFDYPSQHWSIISQ